jgi:hypothetical protein
MSTMNAKQIRQLIEEVSGVHPIPEHTAQSLIDYVEHGWQPGSFLTAVLENDLEGAAFRADQQNKLYLANIAMIVRWSGADLLHKANKCM